MIFEAILGFFFDLCMFIVGLLPAGSVPEWLGDGNYLTSVWTAAAGLGAWVPWSLFGQVSGAVVGAMVLGFAIKLVRIVASFFTAGGGSAA